MKTSLRYDILLIKPSIATWRYHKEITKPINFNDKVLKGEIRIVDIWGSMEGDMDFSYDIFKAEDNTHYKRIPENAIVRKL